MDGAAHCDLGPRVALAVALHDLAHGRRRGGWSRGRRRGERERVGRARHGETLWPAPVKPAQPGVTGADPTPSVP